LHAITAGPDLYDMYTPILIGLIGGALVVFAVPVFDKLKLDDPVGALSVHLVNGIWGTLAVGLFVSDKVKDLNGITFLGQLKGVAIVAIFVFIVSYAVLFVINKIVRFRADDEAQVEGLDVQEVGVEAYPEFKRAI
jgi:ammonium transporter, Amt family